MDVKQIDHEMRVKVPPGRAGNWRVERFKVSDVDAIRCGQLQALGVSNPSGGRPIYPGRYTRLVRQRYGRRSEVVMSDTLVERRDHYEPVLKATGVCLINGLGLGMVAQAMLAKTEVTKVVAIEVAADVIRLVMPYYRRRFGDRFEVIEADALEYKPPKGQRYGAVWHDIWSRISADNLPEMHRLHCKYGRRADWQGSWARGICERLARSERVSQEP